MAAAITGAVFAGVLSAGVAQAKVISTSLIGGTGIRNAAEAPEWGIATKVSLTATQASRTQVLLKGAVSIVEQTLAPVDQLGCAEDRQIVLLKWTQTAGAKTRRTGDDRFEWAKVKAVHTDEFGDYKTKVDSKGGKFLARATKDAFTAEYGDLITCKPGESKPDAA